jgi:hypothetical protein
VVGIDTGFDFRTDSNGLDPDFASPTLRKYHQRLWSKSLPSGEHLNLTEGPGLYLQGSAGGVNLSLSSDSISNSMAGHKSLVTFAQDLPPGLIEDFKSVGSTMGSRILFPANKVDQKLTINVARGLHPRLKDRFDFTLECVRLFYEDQPSPLTSAFTRYREFFNLFETFEGYVDFFLLQDLVQNSKVKFFTDKYEPFSSSASPANKEVDLIYAARSIDFVAKRNERILKA